MQILKGGPVIPEELLRAHEDGDVVFFAGAGVSKPAGIPGFKGVVDQLYAQLLVEPTREQKRAIKEHRYDVAINLLER